ncbi:MAG: S-layer protein [Candidatus Methanofastidiosia archaeon]
MNLWGNAMHLKRMLLITLCIVVLFTSSIGQLSSEEDIERGFFIDSLTGHPNCVIVVGKNSAVADILSASWIATQIGSMSYYDETITIYEEHEIKYDSHTKLYNSMESTWHDTTEKTLGLMDFRWHDSALIPDSIAVLPYSCSKSPSWDYDVYIDANTPFLDSDNFMVDTGFSYESVSIDMSIRDINTAQKFCNECSAAIDQHSKVANDDVINKTLKQSQTYPAIFPRHYWGTTEKNIVYDPVGGIEYRSIAYGYPILKDPIAWMATTANTTLLEKENIQTIKDVYTSSGELYFLGAYYDVLYFGTDEEGYDYMLYGKPKLEDVELEEKSIYRSSNGWSLQISSINIYNANMKINITGPNGVTNTKEISVGETFAIKDSLLPGVEPTILAIKLNKISIRATRIAECTIYSLSNYGTLKETIYGTDAPYVYCNDELWYLDIMPGDSVQEKDLDNEASLYLNGNPSYSASDKLSIYVPASGEPLCVPYLELWLATPVELVSIANEKMEICLQDMEKNEYIFIEISDHDHSDYLIDDYIRIYCKTQIETDTIRNYVEIDSYSLALKDSELTVDMKSEYNIILVGGPVANSIVQEMMALNFTTYDEWALSSGCFKVYKDVFVTGKDVIIVAGKDREATNQGARFLIDAMSRIN